MVKYNDPNQTVIVHPTCTGAAAYGSGDGSEVAIIPESAYQQVFGYQPRDDIERIIMSEAILAKAAAEEAISKR
ncbi:MAG: hypothetical protein J4428_04215 [Candidatus Aenigmarchaeota archaeon]|nr:hypothetical protein [Candidatus Aenigmarchaeota archaeon]